MGLDSRKDLDRLTEVTTKRNGRRPAYRVMPTLGRTRRDQTRDDPGEVGLAG